MAETHLWQKDTQTQAFLLALDISGFSRHMDEPDQLLEHRTSFFGAVAQTSLCAEAKPAGTAVTHFLGDELRLALCGSVGVQAVCIFVDAVLGRLTMDNRNIEPERQTRVKGVVFFGVVIWREWRRVTTWMGRCHAKHNAGWRVYSRGRLPWTTPSGRPWSMQACQRGNSWGAIFRVSRALCCIRRADNDGRMFRRGVRPRPGQ